MKNFAAALILLLTTTHVAAQCHVDTIPAADNNGGQCYLDQVIVDGNTISSGSGFTPSVPSYQSFSSPYVMLRQGEQHWIDMSVVHSSFYAYCIWIDFNNDSIYSSTELALYNPSTNANGVFEPIQVPGYVMPDTVHMRITVLEFTSGWGPGSDDACLAPGIGETEDYLAVIQCAYPQSIVFDPAPIICYADSIELYGISSNLVAWYTGSPMTLQSVSSNASFYLPLLPGTTDTTVYLEFASPGCFSGWFETMQITILPSPVANILGPDTVQSCGPVTLNATPGPYAYNWNIGDTGSTITVNSGFGGMLTLSVSAPNGCADYDYIWANIAPAPPANYATADPGSSYCQNLELYLNYDSLIAPGTCTWYTYPATAFIGTGSQVIYTLPDTGVYQFMAVVNSVCGIDTIIRTVNGYLDTHYDSVYVVGATQDTSGTYILCYSGSGSFTTIAAGVNGTVIDWILTDVTIGFSMSWSDDDTLVLPSNMATQGHVYSAQAILIGPMGCYDTTAAVMLTPANTINFNLPDTSWACSFPHWIGQPSPDYGVYDILWNTGDTTMPLSIPGMGTYTLYTMDNVTGCSILDTTVVWNQALVANIFPDTVASCNGQVYYDLSLYNYTPVTWEEYTTGWSMISNDPGNSEHTVYDNGSPVYLVAVAQTSAGCMFSDTAYIDFNSGFSFSLGPDVNTMITPYTLTAPAGYPSYYWLPSNVTTQSIQVSSTGTFTLIIDNGQGCVASDSITVNILPTTLTEHADAGSISIFPNPAREEVTFRSATPMNTVRIYDAQGRLVRSESTGGATSYRMNTTGLESGVYITEVVTEKGTVRGRLIIQH